MLDKIKFDIAVAANANRKFWKNEKTTWQKLKEKLKSVHRTHETYEQYMSYTKEEQNKIKDIGGFVGGFLRGGKRNKNSVVHRQLLTLDLDFAKNDFWDDFTLKYGYACVLHSTHKHSEKSPRFRLIIPLDREVLPDEYGAISRMVASQIGMKFFDPTTFDVNRLMFWPSAAKDGEFVCEFQDGDLLCADDILTLYTDWTDISEWPVHEMVKELVNSKVKKQKNPLEKHGLIGAFCRTYTIQRAIVELIPDTYSLTTDENRFTYKLGTTAGGLVVYEDKFAYSHHSSDPCSGKLCNVFDFVRLHKFGLLDDEKKQTDKKLPSVKAMEEFAVTLAEVKSLLLSEQIDNAKFDFAQQEYDDNGDWESNLEMDARGSIVNSAQNLLCILKNDTQLKNRMYYNLFDNKRYITKDLPWRKIELIDQFKDVDYAGIRSYIETVYGIVSSGKIDDALALEFNSHSYHPICDYLNKLEWDGVTRIDNLLIDYFGAEDNRYTREVLRKSLVAAVARVFNPGIKFDNVLVLVGPQGTKKSTFFSKLGQEWFSDTFTTMSGKEAFEQLQGAWIIEMGELAGMQKSQIETVKHFIAKSKDSFRPAYGRVTETFKRQCVFFGTTNDAQFLKDMTGNRRFYPVKVRTNMVTKDVFSYEFNDSIHQIWAEAKWMYDNDEPLTLNKNSEQIAIDSQIRHTDIDDRKGIIEKYLSMKVPANWEQMDIFARQQYFDNDDLRQKGTIVRTKICTAEIWCECFKQDKKDMSRYKTRELNDIMKCIPEWEMSDKIHIFSNYGRQRFYENTLL